MEGVDSQPEKRPARRAPERTPKSHEGVKKEMLAAVKNGTDREGVKLYMAYGDSIKDPEASSFVGETYKKAQYSLENIDREGEENKLIASLDSLYRQAGVNEGYKPEIEHEGELPNDEKQRLMREKIAKDFHDYPELYAENKMGRYVEARAKMIQAEGGVGDLVDKDMAGRAELSAATYQIQQERTGLFNVIEEEAKQIKNEELGKELIESIKAEYEFDEKPLDKSFGELEENEQNEMVGASANEYQELYAGSHEKHLDALKFLSDEERQDIFGSAATLDREIQNKRENLKVAMINSPEDAVRLASELRSLQVEKRLSLSEASIDIAKKRTELSKEEWKNAAGELLSGFIRRKGQKEGVWGKFKDSLNERVSAKKDEIGKSIGRDVREATLELREGLDEEAERFRHFYEKVDEKLLSRVRKVTEGASQKFKKYKEDLRDSKAKLDAEQERKRVILRKTYYRSRKNTSDYYKETIAKIGYGWRTRRETAWMNVIGKGGEWIGSEQVSENLKHRGEVLDRYEKLHKIRLESIRNSDNPHMDVFKKDLEERFKFVDKAVGNTKSEEKKNVDTTQENAGKQKKKKEVTPKKEKKPKQAEKNEKKQDVPKNKGIELLTKDELNYRINSDKENFDNARQNNSEGARDKNWETILEKANKRYLQSLEEVDRRLNKRLTPQAKERIKAVGPHFDLEGANANLEAHLKRIDDLSNAEDRAQQIEQYSVHLGQKEQTVTAYLKMIYGS
jgi:hypothetical protein